MFDPAIIAYLYCALILLVIAFQFGLMLGAPWGEMAMGGKYPGKFPPAMRAAASIQIFILALFAGVVLSRAGLMFANYSQLSQWAIWIVVVFSLIGAIMNIITPSKKERLLWAPVAIGLFLCAVRIALS